MKLKTVILLCCCITGMVSIITYEFGASGNNKLSIVEVCRKLKYEEKINGENQKVEYSYIDVCNNGDFTIKIDRLYISEDIDSLREVRENNLEIKPHETYHILKDYDFFLEIRKSGGDIIYISNDKGKVLDKVELPQLENNYSYKLVDNNWETVECYHTIEETVVEKPTFSVNGGFYDNPFNLEISVPENTTVYYTTDGSDPTIDSIKYVEPIYIYDKSSEENVYRNIPNVVYNYDYLFKEPAKVDKCFVLRAIAVDENGNESQINTQSYFINLDKYKDTKVISLVTDPKNLFDEETGIYVTGKEYDDWYSVLTEERKKEYDIGGRRYTDETKKTLVNDGPVANFERKGKSWEREANFEYFNDNSNSINHSVGIKVQGASSRWFPAKRFNIYSRKDYGTSSYFDYEIYENHKTHSINLRYSTSAQQTFINAFTQKLLSDRNVGWLDAIPVNVFLDGEFLYQTYMYEKYSSRYIEQIYGVNHDNVTIAKVSEIEEGNDESVISYRQMYNYIDSHDMSENEAYDYLSQYMDMQSYIDFEASNIYLANMDYSETKNYMMWRTNLKEDNKYGDGRWRWLFYDMDLLTRDTVRKTEGVSENYQLDSFSIKGAYVGNAVNENALYKALSQNPVFARQFVNTFMDLCNTNFSVSNVEKKLQEMDEDLSYDNYFFMYRQDYILKYLEKEYGLKTKREYVTIKSNKPEAGVIELNSIKPELKNGKWSGQYYRDYTIDLLVNPGYGEEIEYIEVDGEKHYTNKLEIDIKEGGSEINVIFK